MIAIIANSCSWQNNEYSNCSCQCNNIKSHFPYNVLSKADLKWIDYHHVTSSRFLWFKDSIAELSCWRISVVVYLILPRCYCLSISNFHYNLSCLELLMVAIRLDLPCYSNNYLFINFKCHDQLRQLKQQHMNNACRNIEDACT